MIEILLKGHDYKYELSEFLKLFSSEFLFFKSSEDFNVQEGIKQLINQLDIVENEDKIIIYSKTEIYENKIKIYEKDESDEIFKNIYYNSNDIDKNSNDIDKIRKKIDNKIKTISKRVIQRSMFYFLKENFDANVPWGILTGIRPVKIVHSLLDEGKSLQEIESIMKKEYLISDEKLDLIIKIANKERDFIYPLSKDKISLYVSIPFCPTRCLYCSFPSHILGEFGNLRKEYIEALLKEAKGLQELIKKQNKEIETLYIGGGTPTSLEAEDLDYLIKNLFNIFDLSKIKEFTVEAGRPDTINEDKLKVLKENNVGRISINPQTMNDETLEKVGRKHSVEDIINCFNLARKVGFDNINMDIILGLPGESVDMVQNTIDNIIKLNPESITVHTLAIKRASNLKLDYDSHAKDMASYKKMTNMINLTREKLDEEKYYPYYMYRQKYMLGNLENIGYAKEGYECLYNMQIMEDRQSNYAIGAGAVSKFVYLDENRIDRVDDVKNLTQYIDRVDEMILKKIKEVDKNENKSS